MEYFKYFRPERADVLENMKVRFTQASVLNDPFESFPGIIQKNKEWYKKEFTKIISREADEHNFRSVVKRKQFLRARKRDFGSFYKCYTDEKKLGSDLVNLLIQL